MATIGERVRREMDRLPRAERRVAHTLLAGYPMVGLDTVAEFAQRANTSGPTILRFIKRLGFDSYSDFQHTLRRELQERLESPLSRYDQSQPADSSDTCERLTRSICANVERAASLLSRGELLEIVDLLADRQRSVSLLGGRFTHLLAGYFHRYLRELRPRVYLLEEGGQRWAEWLMDCGRQDILIVFDVRRYQHSVIELARNAENRGVTVILVTDVWGSPITDSAQYVLTMPVETTSAYDSGAAGLAIVEVVVASLVERMGEDARKRMRRLESTRATLPSPASSNADDPSEEDAPSEEGA